MSNLYTRSLPGGSVVKNPPAIAGDAGSILGWRRSPREGNGNALQSSCLENPLSHEQRSLASYSLWGHKESDTTEHVAQPVTVILESTSTLFSSASPLPDIIQAFVLPPSSHLFSP